jgi:hypothetical protein
MSNKDEVKNTITWTVTLALYLIFAALIKNYGGKALSNVSRYQLTNLYEDASLYWHATDLNCDSDTKP